MFGFRPRWLIAIIGAIAVLALAAAEVDARPGGGRSFGSRGSRTFSAPPPTQTAPTTARPMDRTMTQPTQAARPGATATNPA